MEELWRIACIDSDKERWTKEVHLTRQDTRMLLKFLLCRTLADHEIIDAVEGSRGDLLEVREERGHLFTAASTLLHYTARKLQPST